MVLTRHRLCGNLLPSHFNSAGHEQQENEVGMDLVWLVASGTCAYKASTYRTVPMPLTQAALLERAVQL